jgi:hypothetical protein
MLTLSVDGIQANEAKTKIEDCRDSICTESE